MKTPIVIAFVAALCAASAVAQGRYDINIAGVVYKITLATVEGNNVVIDAEGMTVPGFTWRVLDADGDNQNDDIRIEDAGGGKLDMPDGALGTGTSDGDCHDGNVQYPDNVIPDVDWKKA